MTSVLIAGDSWASGEWDRQQKITHKGLEQYFKDTGFEVKNVAKPGGTLEEIIQRLQDENLENYDYIFVIVTCTNRSVTKKFTRQEEFFNLEEFNKENIITRHINILDNFCNTLNNFDKKIYLLGGLSVIDKGFAQKYKNISIAVPSIIELILPDLGKDYQFFFHLGNAYRGEISKDTINWMWEQNQIWDKISKSVYFKKDGYHPDRNAHYKVFTYLMKNVVNNDK